MTAYKPLVMASGVVSQLSTSDTLTATLDAPPWATTTKLANEARSSDTALTSDDEVLFAVVANGEYRFRGVVFWNTNTTADFKFDFDGPAAPTLVRIVVSIGSDPAGGFSANGLFSAFNELVTLTGTETDGGMHFEGIVHNGANAGNVSFRWAQNTSDGGNTTVYAGSYIEYKRIDS